MSRVTVSDGHKPAAYAARLADKRKEQEFTSLSTTSVTTAASPVRTAEVPQPARPPLLTKFGPVVAAAAALAAHGFLPDRQRLPMTWMDPLPFWQHPYAVLLELLFIAAVLLAGPWTFGSISDWKRYHAPLLTGAIAVMGLWDLVTQKLDWMKLPYFPGPDLVLGAIVQDRAVLLESAWRSLLLLLSGYAIGALAGVSTGVLLGCFPLPLLGMPVLRVIGPLPATVPFLWPWPCPATPFFPRPRSSALPFGSRSQC